MSDIDTYSRCKDLIDAGDTAGAVSLARQIADPGLRGGILIDGGFALQKPSLVRQGIADAEAVLAQAGRARPRYSYSSMFYNLGNGYAALFGLRRRLSEHPIVAVNDDDIRAAKRAFRQAIAHLRSEPSSFVTQLWVNYGNCLSQFGRGIEAIQCYRTALQQDPSNGMAAGNLGIELKHVAGITGRYRHNYMLAAQHSLSEALGPHMHLRYGSPEAKEDFRRTKTEIETFFARHSRRVRATRPDSPPSRNRRTLRYISFCQENSLFLNAWAGDPSDLPARSDEVSFGPISTPIHDNATVPELLNILNEIKESFTTARYLLYIAMEADPLLKDASSLTSYFRYDQVALYGTPLGLLKGAYSQAFDVLDKVARLLNVYFHIGTRRDSFWHILVSRESRGEAHILRWVARPRVAATLNSSLYALADIAIDYFEPEHTDLSVIDTRRNRMTHDYLLVFPGNQPTSDDQSSISLRQLSAETLRTLRLAKNAVLYAISAISTTERTRGTGQRLFTEAYHHTHGLPSATDTEPL